MQTAINSLLVWSEASGFLAREGASGSHRFGWHIDEVLSVAEMPDTPNKLRSRGGGRMALTKNLIYCVQNFIHSSRCLPHSKGLQTKVTTPTVCSVLCNAKNCEEKMSNVNDELRVSSVLLV